MGLFKKEAYQKCSKNEEDGSVECLSYKPTRDGKKMVTATIKGQMSPDCKFSITDTDGDPAEVEKLSDYLGKHVRAKCNKAGGESL